MSHSLKLVLAADELLALQLAQPCRVLATSGRHWLTVNGRDICLDETCRSALLPRGKVLIEGCGRLELYAEAQSPRLRPRLHLNTVSI
ncbi:hypothetical protein [Paludibacterium yongneupense]|uniref:hypothetical protein n=1 Tax=Paludibacterium yongneupense TaxID=400061 RepID=UPI00040A11EB|nr:hypothetical protein [Paludibacterium yongneupense]